MKLTYLVFISPQIVAWLKKNKTYSVKLLSSLTTVKENFFLKIVHEYIKFSNINSYLNGWFEEKIIMLKS
jgi:hypothetical protein